MKTIYMILLFVIIGIFCFSGYVLVQTPGNAPVSKAVVSQPDAPVAKSAVSQPNALVSDVTVSQPNAPISTATTSQPTVPISNATTSQPNALISISTAGQSRDDEDPRFNEIEISIDGKVLTKDGMPVEGAIVSMQFPKRLDFITKSDGFFSFSNIITRPISMPCSIVALSTGYVAGSAVTATDIRKSYTQDIVMPKGGFLKGRVLDENHKPMSGASIDLDYAGKWWNNVYQPSWDPEYSHLKSDYPSLVNPGMETRLLITGTDGTFRTGLLVPGSYDIVASCTGYQPILLEKIKVIDEEETNHEIVLIPSLKIAGLVTGPTGAPQEEVALQLEKYDPFSKPAQINPLIRSFVNIPGVQSRMDMVDIAGKAMDMNIKQTGLVDRMALPFAKRILHKKTSFITQNDGKFEFDQLEPGSYRIFARWNASGNDVVDTMPSELVVSDLKPGDMEVQIHFTDALKKRPTIRGTVIDKRYGDLMKTFSVASGGFAKGYSGSRQFQNRENDAPLPEGEFLIKNIMPKPFTLWINAPGYCAKEVLVSNLMAGKEYDIFVALKKEGKITGKLILENYEDLKNYKLELRALDYQPQTTENRAVGKLIFDAKVSNDGTFTYDILSSGIYQLIISDRERRRPLLVMNNLQVDFDKVLDLGEIHFDTPEARKTFSILIQSDDGTPVPGGELFFPEFNITSYYRKGKCDFPAQIVDKEKGVLVGVGVTEPNEVYAEMHPESIQVQPPAFYYPIKEASDVVLLHPKFIKQKNTQIVKGTIYEKDVLVKTGVAKLITDPGKEPLQIYSLQMNDLGQIHQSIEASSRVFMLAGKESLGRFLPRSIRYGELNIHEEVPFVRVDFGQGKNITGLVRNKDGESVPGALLQFALHSSAGGEIVDRILQRELTQCTRADQYGLFIIPDLQPGTYTVWASLYGEGVSEKKEIVVEKEDVKSLVFEVK